MLQEKKKESKNVPPTNFIIFTYIFSLPFPLSPPEYHQDLFKVLIGCNIAENFFFFILLLKGGYETIE